MQTTTIESLALDISAVLARATKRGITSISALQALLYIHDAGNPSMSGIAAHIGITNAGLTHLVDALEKKGLVRRSRPDADRRSIRIELTFHGREVVREFLDAAQP